jgi:DNA-directed RNA polymerase subunit H (RpoH/RPB5)
MNHNTDVPVDSGRGTRAAIGGAVIGTTLGALALALLPGAPATAGGSGDPIHCDRGIRLKYLGSLLALEDSDGDGFTDADERAAGSDPKDPNSRPLMLDVLDLVFHSGLPSFEERFSEVVILPEALPDGRTVDGAADLASLSEALGRLAPSRKEGLSRLGISTDLMKEMGAGGSDVLSIVAGARTSKGQPAFEGRIGGINASWISAGPSGTIVTEMKPDDGKRTFSVVWSEPNGKGGTDSYTMTVEKMADGELVPSGQVITTQDGQTVGEPKQCSGASDCTSAMPAAVDKANAAVLNQTSPAPASPPPGQQQPATAAPAPVQPSAAPSTTQPSGSASDDEEEEEEEEEEELAPIRPVAKPSGGYEDPNAQEVRAVITRTDVQRVVRIVRGSNTTSTSTSMNNSR